MFFCCGNYNIEFKLVLLIERKNYVESKYCLKKGDFISIGIAWL